MTAITYALSVLSPTTLIAGGVVLFVAFFIHSSLSGSNNQALKGVKKPEEIHWLDQDCYATLAAICDTLFPSLSTNECNEKNFRAALRDFHPQFYDQNKAFIDGKLAKNKKYLFTGAVEYGTPKHAAEALQNSLTIAERDQLYYILKALSTTLGSFLLTGHLSPFQVAELFFFKFIF
jgi:hypothetical protein